MVAAAVGHQGEVVAAHPKEVVGVLLRWEVGVLAHQPLLHRMSSGFSAKNCRQYRRYTYCIVSSVLVDAHLLVQDILCLLPLRSHDLE